MKKNILLLIMFFNLLFHSIPAYSNVIWPALYMHGNVSNPSFIILVVISIIIEGFLLYSFIGNISLSRSIFISSIGNSISTLIGALILPLLILAFDYFLYRLSAGRIDVSSFFGGTFSIYNIIYEFMLMYFGTVLIELFTIKRIFKYPVKKLLIPILVGNTITYLFTASQFPDQVNQVKSLLGIQQAEPLKTQRGKAKSTQHKYKTKKGL